MCQEVVTETNETLTTPRELSQYLGVDCTEERFLEGYDEDQLEELRSLPTDWRDCCLCGIDIEGICKKAGKQVEWDDDPMVLLIKTG